MARPSTRKVEADRVVSAKPDEPRRLSESASAQVEARPLRVLIPHQHEASHSVGHTVGHSVELILRAALIQVGRADPAAGFVPELDLTPYGGLERGVSRRHATIQWVEDGIILVDRHSSNGTWLNGVRLVAGYAYQVPPDAGVRFGDLLVHISVAD
jgi:pSer/pThr/pTyr-binding forkhead associated (FHA) protein